MGCQYGLLRNPFSCQFSVKRFPVTIMQMEMFAPEKTVHSVSEITAMLKRLIEQHQPFQNVWVLGQVSNCSFPRSGHIYFTLKDENTQMSCVLWRSNAARFRSFLRDGEAIEIQGKVTVYGAQGKYQITVSQVKPLGVGALQRAFEELKQRLTEEGLFDPAHKKPLPGFPRKIGVVTSASGAAIQDIYQQLNKRYRLAEIVLHPTLVQGEGAADGIVHAIRMLNACHDIDVLIVGRGGGSVEDLWAFNEEVVARAIFASRIPVVSAVGHETDFTISDMVADHRAPTPSAAVEHIVPDQYELFGRLEGTETWLRKIILDRFAAHKTQLQEFETRLSPTRRMEAIHQLSQRVDDLETASRHAMERRLSDSKRDLQAFAHRLNALSPLATLERGYSISRKTDGEVLTSTRQVSVGDSIKVQLAHGHLVCRVEELDDTEKD